MFFYRRGTCFSQPFERHVERELFERVGVFERKIRNWQKRMKRIKNEVLERERRERERVMSNGDFFRLFLEGGDIQEKNFMLLLERKESLKQSLHVA